MRTSLRTQLATGAALLTLLVTALAGIAITAVINVRDRADVDQALVERAGRVADDAEKLATETPSQDGDAYGPLLSGSDSLVRLISGGQVLAERGQVSKSQLAIPTSEGFSNVSIDGVPWRAHTTSLAGGSGTRIEVLTSLGPLQDRLVSNSLLAGLVSVIAGLAAGAGGWFGARIVLRPLSKLRAEATGVRTAHDADLRLTVSHGPLEVVELSSTLNEMLERLGTSSAATRQFTADAGHELRSPLTSLGAYIETMRRNPDLDTTTRARIVREMTVEHERLVNLLTGLQALARGDAGALPTTGPVDLVSVVADAVTTAQRRFPRVQIRDVTSVTEAIVAGWSDGLRVAIDNLIDNAALHGHSDGRVQVAVSIEGASVEVIVLDDGPGMTDQERETLVQRFARGTTTAPGSGLGLALVTQQAELHGGKLLLETGSPHGLRATLRLPRSIR